MLNIRKGLDRLFSQMSHPGKLSLISKPVGSEGAVNKSRKFCSWDSWFSPLQQMRRTIFPVEAPENQQDNPLVQLSIHAQDIEVSLYPGKTLGESVAGAEGTEAFSSEDRDYDGCLIRLAKLESSTKKIQEPSGSSIKPQGGSRKPINRFTQSSRCRLQFRIRNSFCVWHCLTTLTYPQGFPYEGRLIKRHLNTLLTHLRRDYPGLRYLWWLEFQDSGAPHIHLVTTSPIPGKEYMNPLWYHIVGSRNKSHLEKGAHVQPFYGKKSSKEIVAKYAKKMNQKAKPPGFSGVGRYWGCSRAVTAPLLGTISGLSALEVAQLRAKAPQEQYAADSALDQSTGVIWGDDSTAPYICSDVITKDVKFAVTLKHPLLETVYEHWTAKQASENKHPSKEDESLRTWSKLLELARVLAKLGKKSMENR